MRVRWMGGPASPLLPITPHTTTSALLLVHKRLKEIHKYVSINAKHFSRNKRFPFTEISVYPFSCLQKNTKFAKTKNDKKVKLINTKNKIRKGPPYIGLYLLSLVSKRPPCKHTPSLIFLSKF